jgi:hypothetical protein
VLFRLDEDPELIEILCDMVCKRIKYFASDHMLETLVNLSHTLSPEAVQVVLVANEEICRRLSDNYNPELNEMYIQPEDLIKIHNTLLDNLTMTDDLKEVMMEYIINNLSSFTYEVAAELAVIYAVKANDMYKKQFFDKTTEKFIKEMKYLKDETLYKILWSLFKSNSVKIHEQSNNWRLIKEAIVARTKELSPKTLCDIIVLSTTEKTGEEAMDLFS